MKVFQIIFFIAFFSNLALAQEVEVKSECEITPNVWQLKPWPKINKTNNLRRSVGSTMVANGDKIIINGMVTDENCVPVIGAVVQIWQADSLGIMPGFSKDKNKSDPNFLYSGTAITDNLGRFNFLTIFPGSMENKAPFIKFRIIHADFLESETVMFFENQALNQFDKILNHEVAKEKKYLLVANSQKSGKYSSEESIKYQFDITLEGKNKYLKY
jgi:protocatechuate 3,4-dioxygenase beta subunit